MYKYTPELATPIATLPNSNTSFVKAEYIAVAQTAFLYFLMLSDEDAKYLRFVLNEAIGLCVNFDETPMTLMVGAGGGRFIFR